MQEIVMANDLSFRVGKEKGRIHADGNWANARVVEFFQVFLNTSQLEVTEWSPLSAIENQQRGDAFCRSQAADMVVMVGMRPLTAARRMAFSSNKCRLF
jgi:hypothetical protein